ncbi:MAG: hypothetical protein ACFFCW_18085 [Candidatus Hodarchaeota archaeon]
MKIRFLIRTIVVLILSMFMASTALAECPPGKIEVTIVNPAGIVLVICVGEAAVEHIGGPGDVVIPAGCPGWSVADVDYWVESYAEIACSDAPIELQYGTLDCRYFDGVEWQSLVYLQHVLKDGGYYFYKNIVDGTSDVISEDEHDACFALFLDHISEVPW